MKGIGKAYQGIISVLAAMLVSMKKQLPERRLSSGMMVLVVAGVVLVVAAGSVSADTEITQGMIPYTTTTDGERYFLTTDLACADATTSAITIANDNIIIDGQGHKITGTVSGTDCAPWDTGESYPAPHCGIVNFADKDNVVIHDLELENFCTGIALGRKPGAGDTDNNTVTGCKIHNCGKSATSTHGIHIVGANNCTITNNEIHNITGSGAAAGCSGGGNGIFLYGVNSDRGNHNAIDGNELHDNMKSGFFMKMMPQHNTISNNIATRNSQGGIVLRCMKSNYNIIEGNIVSENNALAGIYVGGKNNTIRYNIVTSNNVCGINMARDDGSYNNYVYENTVCGNEVADIKTCGPSCYGNHGHNNTCNTTSHYNDTGTTGCTFDCSPAPDLTITEKSEEWIDQANKTYNLTYTIKNIGDADAGESNTSIRIDGAEVATDPVPQLPPDHTHTATVGTFTMSDVSDTINICADRDYVIVEKSKEYNNCLESIFIYSELPDLVITEKSEEWIVEGSSYNITYTVTNIGNVDAGASNTSIRIDGAEVATDPVGILAAGGNHTSTVGPFTMAGECDTIRICADSESVVGEISEDNCLENIFWHEIADLVMTDKFEEWVVGNETYNIYNITYTVTNIGTADANASNISIKIDGVEVAVDSVGTLAPDESYTSTIGHFTMSGENDVIMVCADNELAIIESDEANNCLENTFEYSEVGCVASDGTLFRCGNTVTGSCTFNGGMTCQTTRYGLVIGADDITIDGVGYALERTDSGECTLCPSVGILNKGYDNVTIANLEIKHFCNGIHLDIDYDEGEGVVYGNTIENCNIHHNGNATAPSATHGIKMRYVFNSTIRNNSIHNQIAHVDPDPGCEDGGNGLFLYIGDYNNITGNRFYNNTKAGMLIKMRPKYWNISHNHLWGNGQGGIILRCKLCDFNLIEHNNASDNYGSGIFIGGNDNTIRYNTVCNNRDGGPYYEDSVGGSGYGIHIGRGDGSLNNTLISNTVCGNDYLDIRVVTGVTGNTGDENTCNTTYNYNDDGTTGCTYPCGPAGVCGDVDGDGMITMEDVGLLWPHVFFPVEYPLVNEWAGDVDGDGMITMGDVGLLWPYVFFPEEYPLNCSC